MTKALVWNNTDGLAQTYGVRTNPARQLSDNVLFNLNDIVGDPHGKRVFSEDWQHLHPGMSADSTTVSGTTYVRGGFGILGTFTDASLAITARGAGPSSGAEDSGILVGFGAGTVTIGDTLSIYKAFSNDGGATYAWHSTARFGATKKTYFQCKTMAVSTLRQATFTMGFLGAAAVTPGTTTGFYVTRVFVSDSTYTYTVYLRNAAGSVSVAFTHVDADTDVMQFQAVWDPEAGKLSALMSNLTDNTHEYGETFATTATIKNVVNTLCSPGVHVVAVDTQTTTHYAFPMWLATER